MKIVPYLLFILFWVAILDFMRAQAPDSSILSFDKYLEMVEKHHPVAKQAELVLKQGSAAITRAKGAFDPKLQADLAKKSFNGKTYYDIFQGGLKVPTWLGLEFYGGLQQTQGIYLNPENTVPDGGLVQAGVSLPIGQGLFIDQRRAELRKAQLFEQSTLAERQAIYNTLFYEAGKSYWDWFKAFHVLQVYTDAQSLAVQRLEAVKQAARLGDRPLIDTLEAEIQVQNRMLSVQEAQMNYDNATINLELFLWREGLIPLELTPGTTPEERLMVIATAPADQIRNQIDSLSFLHPDLVQFRFKLEQLGIDQRLKREKLKPKLDVKYNFLTEPVGNAWVSNINPDNYTWGFSFSMPLFLRKERSELKLTHLKMESLQYEISRKQESTLSKAQIAINNLRNTFRQAELANRQVRGYAQLFEGEQRLFSGGESSLFLVNSRETSYIQAQLKYLDILTKNRKADLESNFSLGLLLRP